MNKNITIFGGSGFIGRYIIQELARQDWSIRVIVRHLDKALFLRTFGIPGQINLVSCNIFDPKAVESVIQGSYIVINLLGILYENKRQTFHNIHVIFPEILAKSALKDNLKRIIHVSALGIDNNFSSYAKTKKEGENIIKHGIPESIILRPSVVFGAEDKFFNLFAKLSTFLPILPLVGAHTKLQPIYVHDIAKAVGKIIKDDLFFQKSDQIYELAGYKIYTLKELVEFVLLVINRRRLIVPLPFWAAYLEAFFLEKLPNPLLTYDQVKSLRYDNILSDNFLKITDLGINPAALETIVPHYIKRYKSGGFYTKNSI